MLRFVALATVYLSVTASADCKQRATPEDCLENDTCTWLILQGQCQSSTEAVTRRSPPTCCASSTARSPCVFHTADIRDGECSVPHTSPSRTFSLDYATRMLHLSGAAYCNAEQVTQWSCGVHCTDVHGISEQVYINNVSQDLAAFVAWDSISNAVVVSFRGTVSTSIEDWVHDLSYTKTYPLTQFPSAGVHHGFWESWEVLEQGIVHAIQGIMTSHGTTSVHVTGHSLGAALATDAAISLKLKYGYSTTLINFESPRAGDRNFMEAVVAEVPDSWRITHSIDIVPHAPPEKFGFYHIPTEVFFPAGNMFNLTFNVCDGSGEDANCSDRCAASLTCISVYDHLHLMGFVLGSDACANGTASFVV